MTRSSLTLNYLNFPSKSYGEQIAPLRDIRPWFTHSKHTVSAWVADVLALYKQTYLVPVFADLLIAGYYYYVATTSS